MTAAIRIPAVESIDAKECARRLGVSRKTFDDETRRLPGFPAARRLSRRIQRWDWGEVVAWWRAQGG
mgnify:CR=1 FL=1